MRQKGSRHSRNQWHCQKASVPSVNRYERALANLVYHRLINCNQVIATNVFRSTISRYSYSQFHNINGQSNYVIHLLECICICKTQYLQTCKARFNICLANHSKNAKSTKGIPSSINFKRNRHHVKFTLILSQITVYIVVLILDRMRSF